MGNFPKKIKYTHLCCHKGGFFALFTLFHLLTANPSLSKFEIEVIIEEIENSSWR